MQVEASGGTQPVLRRALRALLVVGFAVLAILLLAIFTHAATSGDGLLIPIRILSLVLGGVFVGSVLVGIAYSWRAFPQHRRAVIFVVVITLATLLAHAYIIGAPAASAGGSVSGTAGTNFSDKQISVDSSMTGQVLNVTIRPTGGNAIADLQVTSASGATLPGPGLSTFPTYSFPLQPGSSTTGKWDLPSTGSNSSISVSYQYLTCYSTSSKTYGCIMDEVFYIPEAMGVLSGQHCSTTGPNCHMEHPYLVPALIAAGLAVFGQYNVVGWRVAPVLLGTFSIPLLFGIAWKVSGSKKIAYISALLLSLDVMFFSQSSGALLDAPETFFGVAAFFAYVAGLRVWRIDKYVISGVMLGVAGLAKETAIFIALGFLTYLILFDETTWRAKIYNALKVTLVVALVFAAGLQAYDSTLASPAVPTFVQHVGYIFSYGSSLIANKLACQPTTGYWCKFANDPGGAPILPTDWLLYYSPVAYYATSVSVCPNVVNNVCQGGQYSYVALAYYGVTNLLETWTVFVWVPIVAYLLYSQLRRKQPSLEEFGFEETGASSPGLSGEVKFAGLALVWFLWTYVPYIGLFLAGRVTYPFYFVPAIPAVAMGCSYWLTRKWFPRPLMFVYLLMVFVFFFVYFPEKAFLPDWLRVIIGH
jgi:hypothetical protein